MDGALINALVGRIRSAGSPDAVVACGGCGAVRLHERDDELFAMLLDRVQKPQAHGETSSWREPLSVRQPPCLAAAAVTACGLPFEPL